MQYYAVIDTNVLVSAMIRPESIPGSVVTLAFSGPIIPVLDQTIENEYRAVLSRPKFHLTNGIIDAVIDTFRSRGLYIDADRIDIDLPDPKDKIFYQVVMEERKSEDAYLVTGNMKHFPSRPFIVTPRQMIDIILRDPDT